MRAYDRNNAFARILRGEEPCIRVYEDEFALAFENNRPAAPIHVLVIPKGEYVSAADFAASAPPELIVGFWRAVARTASKLGLDGPGYRLVANHGADANQEIFHLSLVARGSIACRPLRADPWRISTIVIDTFEHFGYYELRRPIQAAALYASFISILARGRPATRPGGLAPAAA